MNSLSNFTTEKEDYCRPRGSQWKFLQKTFWKIRFWFYFLGNCENAV